MNLEDLLKRSVDAAKEQRRVEEARKRLAKSEPGTIDRAELASLVNKYEESRVWDTTANIALVLIQTCTSCGTTHRFFQGWMREQKHRVFANTRRLIAGKSDFPLPSRIEHHLRPSSECADCLERKINALVLVIPSAASSESCSVEPSRPAA